MLAKEYFFGASMVFQEEKLLDPKK